VQIIIPMSSFGERFRRAGYTVPKPLIEVDGKPIISHVIDLFPGETNFIFICNEDHLDNPD
jgi:NDP-sugar pyrophosphorylase family protein